MDTIIAIGRFILENWDGILAAVIALLSGIIAVAMFIPGDQPEKTLQKIVDFISKFSRKPKAE